MNIQFKKGVLELCVLSLLEKGDNYGYELVEKISHFIDISEGTIYPMLRKLSKDGYVETYLKESPSGPPRKYYTLSEEGSAFYHSTKNDWQQFVIGVNKLLEGVDQHE